MKLIKWYYAIDGEKNGPTEEFALKALIERGALKKTDYVWNKTMGSEWTLVADIPSLANTPVIDEQITGGDAAFNAALKGRHKLEARRRVTKRITAVITILVLAGLGYLGFLFFKSKPLRQWGINSSNPVGALAKLEKFLLEEKQMKKVSVNHAPFIRQRTARMYHYSKPQAPRGQFVTGAGSIILLADDNDQLKGITVEYPSPGNRPRSGLINPSVLSIFTDKFWLAITRSADLHKKKTEEMQPTTASEFGLNNLPKGHCTTYKGHGITACKLEHSFNQRDTLVHFLVVE